MSKKANKLNRQLEGKDMVSGEHETQLTGVIDITRQKLGFSDHIPVGYDEPTFRTKKEPAIHAELDLRQVDVSAQLVALGMDTETAETFQIFSANRALGVNGGSGDPLYKHGSNAAGYSIDKSNAFDLFNTQTAIAKAGAIVKPFPAERGRLLSSEIATFQQVLDDADAPDAGVEFDSFGEWDLGLDDSVPTYGCTIRATRKLEKLIGRSNLEDVLIRALSLGAVQVVDQIATNHLKGALTPGAAPRIADMILKNVDPVNAHAIIGTAPLASQEMDRGSLYFNGVNSVASPALDIPVILGDFSKLVVMVSPKLFLISKRVSVDGSIEMTAFIDVKPFILDSSRFWSVTS